MTSPRTEWYAEIKEEEQVLFVLLWNDLQDISLREKIKNAEKVYTECHLLYKGPKYLHLLKEIKEVFTRLTNVFTRV